ncbi:calcium-binding protein [uncultured Phenylobacterium sp.]|uniref:calcium-binding protein n=1 Tax=uncultured Phenylobacterium sp. TaxID=349273 RepID=UPI0025D0EBA3|nr:calcium-binding protein [uncultured Phenylobacterium sp.]
MAVIGASRFNDTIAGTADADSITGSPGIDLITGGPGADTIVSGLMFGDDAMPDTLRGGAGNDSISLTYGYGGLLFGDNGDDTLTHAPPFPLNLAYVVLEGGPGTDMIDGNASATTTVWAGYLTATSGVSVDLSITGPQAVGGGAGIDTLRNLTGVLGSSFDDVVRGGQNAREELFGGPGNDTLRAGAAGGELHGDAGDDVLVGGPRSDWAAYNTSVAKLNLEFPPQYAATSGLTVSLGISGAQAVGGGLGIDTLVDIDNLRGSAFGDTLTGSEAANILAGEAGDDSLAGGGGGDSLQGGFGRDVLSGGSGNDTFGDTGGPNTMLGGDGSDSVAGSLESDAIQGNTGADTLNGNLGADTIRGGQGDDVVLGGGEDDFLAGDRGADTLTGGEGADVFHAWSGAELDRVTDFDIEEGDRVLLLPGAAPAISQVGGDTVIDFGGGGQMVLTGVQLSSLPAGWIFGA